MKITRNYIRKLIFEERLSTEFADYKVSKDKVTAQLKKSMATKFTKYAIRWTDLDTAVNEYAEEKRKLNELKNKIDNTKTEFHSLLRTEIPELFDAGEQLMTLTIKALGSEYTLNKLSEAKPPTEKTTIDYESIYKELAEFMTGQDGLATKLKEITDKYTKVEQVLSKIPERGLRVKVKESLLRENAFDKIKSFISSVVGTFNKWIGKKETELSKINSKIANL